MVLLAYHIFGTASITLGFAHDLAPVAFDQTVLDAEIDASFLMVGEIDAARVLNRDSDVNRAFDGFHARQHEIGFSGGKPIRIDFALEAPLGFPISRKKRID